MYHVLEEDIKWETVHKLRMMKNDILPLRVSSATMLNAVCSIFLSAKIFFFLSFELKQASRENVSKFRVVSKV